jgi:hypothetical protein
MSEILSPGGDGADLGTVARLVRRVCIHKGDDSGFICERM